MPKLFDIRKTFTKGDKPPAVVKYDGKTFDADFLFEANSLLGSGQFGVVKACKCIKTQKDYCVKIIERKLVYQTTQQEAENDVMKRINHVNVVRLIQIYNNDKQMHIVMERAYGGDMLDRILNSDAGRLEERVTRFYVWQVLCALKYLHSQNIAHRDLKPENVLLHDMSEFTLAKVCDFGYAKMIGEDTFMQSIVGTPAYWAPEIRQGIYTMKVDLWSSGVLCYVSLSGTFPFEEVKGPFDPDCLSYPRMYPTSIPCWAGVSEEGKDWITNSMILNSVERLGVETAMKHPWLQNSQLKADLLQLENLHNQKYLFNSNFIL